MIVTVIDKHGHHIWLVLSNGSMRGLYLVDLLEHVHSGKQMIIDFDSKEAIKINK